MPPTKPPKAAPEIAKIRSRIDAVDQQFLSLLDQRARLAREIGEVKKKLADAAGAEAPPPRFFDPEREESILEKLEARAREKAVLFPEAAIPHVYKEIISACRSLEADFRVAFLGPSGTYTQMAAQRIFGRSVDFVETPTIEGVFDAVTRDQAEYGVAPIENSYEGGVLASMDGLLRSSLLIRRQTVMKVNHCLLAAPAIKKDLSKIRRLYSHPQALGQCRLWIAKNLPGVEVLTSRSTAAAAQEALRDGNSAAIASRLAGELTGLELLREGIQDQANNSTRFIVLSNDGPLTGRDQTSIVMTLRPGKHVLLKALQVFERARVETLRVESRAGSERLWDYHYFVDFKGHRLAPPVAKLLRQLARGCERVKVLGSYPTEESHAVWDRNQEETP